MNPTTRDSTGGTSSQSTPSLSQDTKNPDNFLADRRLDLAAIALLFAVPTILFADLLFFGSQLYSGDLTPFYYPIKKILRTILLAGELPSWNPWWSGGQPFAANPEFHIFYPPHWLILLPDFDHGFRLHILLHTYLALGAAYFLFRDLQVRIPAAFFGALTFGLGGFYLSYLKMPSFYFSIVWIPLIFALGRRFVIRPRAASLAAATLAWGMQLLAGEPTTILQTGVLLGCFALYDAWRVKGHRFKRALRNLSLVAALSLSAFLAGAIQMLPAADHVGDTVRARGLSWEMVRTWSMPWVRPLELVFPDILGENFLHWHRNVYPEKSTGYIDSFHLGTLAALLILGALIYRRRPAGIVAVIAGVSFLMAAGDHTPALRVLYETGILQSIRYPEKFALAGVLALTLLAVLFADRCLRREAGAIRSMLVASVGVAGISALLAAASFTPIYPDLFRWLWGDPSPLILEAIVRSTRIDWTIAAISASMAAGLFAWIRSNEPGTGWMSLMFVLLISDLGISTNELLGRVPEDFFKPAPLAGSLTGDSAAYRTFHAADLEGKVLNAPWTLSIESKFWLARNGMYPRLPGTWGFRSVLETDYDVTNLIPTTDLLAAMFAIRRQTGRDRFPETILAMSNVGYLLTYDDAAARRILATPPENLAIDEVTPIRAVRRHYPRYYFADQLTRIADVGDFVDGVVKQELSGELTNVAYVEFNPMAVGRGSVEQVRETSSSVSMNVRAESPAYLVISITPHKYWRATIDGVPATLHTTNVGYQGLLIPAGRHDVVLVYRNPLITIGAVVSILAFAALMAILMIRRRELGTRSL